VCIKKSQSHVEGGVQQEQHKAERSKANDPVHIPVLVYIPGVCHACLTRYSDPTVHCTQQIAPAICRQRGTMRRQLCSSDRAAVILK